MVSRSVSPAPSLEAILLDRKRRIVASGSQSSTVPVSSQSFGQNFEMWVPSPRIASPSIKGARFKSSPLGGGERSGVVVAEKVKENLRSQNDSQQEVRIPDDKDKAGPDKSNADVGLS
jgi:metal transporter CNNM